MPTTYQSLSAEQWQSTMERFAASGLSQALFCQQQGLAMSTFSKWRKQLGLVGTTVAQKTNNAFLPLAAMTPSPALPAKEPSQFDDHPDDSDWQVELTLGGGITLRIRHTTAGLNG